MTKWILSSSILILMVIGLRTCFKGKISLRLQYAIWGLVLLRLIVPFSIGSTSFSVANFAAYTEVYDVVIHTAEPGVGAEGDAVTFLPQEQTNQTAQFHPSANVPVPDEKTGRADVHWLNVIWAVGFVSVAAAFLLTNIRFQKRIAKSRSFVGTYRNKLRIYSTGRIDTPCLAGIVKPVIYVTPEVAQSRTLLRHTVIHEATHYCHGDHIWAVLRCVCLAIHWYNPLVWWAAFLSQRDAELACDEAVIKRLGEKERAEYGRTLIGMTCQRRANVLITATTMNSGKSGIRERITLIARKPKTALYTLLIVMLAATVAVGCTFTGAKTDAPEADPSEAHEQILDEDGDKPLTGKAEPVGGAWEAAKAKFEGILSGADGFREPEQAQSITISQYCKSFSALSGVEAAVTKYALVDLDADDLPELILWITVNGNDDYGFLVIRYDGNGGAAGYGFTYRQLMNLKADGTFGYSGGALHNGIARLKFTDAGWEYVVLGSIEENNGAISFFRNGQSVSQDEYNAFLEEQDGKDSAKWEAYPSDQGLPESWKM